MTARRWRRVAILAVLLALAFAVDHPLARLMAGAGSATLAILRFVTWFGQGGVVLVPGGLIFLVALWLKPRLPSLERPLRLALQRSAVLFAAVTVAGLANDTIKVIAGRARPGLWLHDGIDGFYFWRLGSDYQSFPSGHTATSVAAAIVFSALFPRWRAVFAGFAVVIAASRVGLDAHYLSDIVAGAAVGTVSAFAVMDRFRSQGWLPSPG